MDFLNKLLTSKINWAQYLAMIASVAAFILHRDVMSAEDQATLIASLKSLVSELAGIQAAAHTVTVVLRTWFNAPKPLPVPAPPTPEVK